MCTSRQQLESLQFLCLFALIEFCFSTFPFAVPNWLCDVELLVGSCSRSSMTSSLRLLGWTAVYSTVRVGGANLTAALPQLIRKTLNRPVRFSGSKSVRMFCFLQFIFVTVYPLCSYRCITNSVRNY